MVPRMIAAGKVSSTTIERSRTTNGWRGSGCAASSACDRADRGRVEIELGDEDRVLPRRTAAVGDGRGELADDADGRAGAVHVNRRGVAGDEIGRVGTARSPGRCPSASASRSTTPLTSKKSTSRAPPPVLRRRAGPGERDAACFAVAREAGADLEQPRRRARPWRRLCATASTRPGSSDGRSTANFSDSGLASGDDGVAAPRCERRGAPALDEREGHRLGEAGRRQHAPDGPVARDARVGRRRRPRSARGTSAASRSKP